jgi:hypothetical protein
MFFLLLQLFGFYDLDARLLNVSFAALTHLSLSAPDNASDLSVAAL